MILLDCRPSSTLNWEIPENGPLFFRFELGLEEPFFALDDEMLFESLSFALKKFRDEMYPHIQVRTKGAAIYRGSADFSSCFSWSEKQLKNFEEWRQGKEDNAQLRRLFCADAFSHYFQMLSHSLPDEMPIYLFLDGTNLGNLAERHQLLSKNRFEHFQIVTRGVPFFHGWLWSEEDSIIESEKVARAICLPQDCPNKLLQEKMDQMQKPYRVISESHLSEEWENVDELHVLKEYLSEQGKRKLRGFEATGGVIVY